MKRDDPPKTDGTSPASALAGQRSYGGYDTIVVATGIMSLGIAAVYWLMRVGFDDPIAVVARPVGLALFISTFPSLVIGALRVTRRREADVMAPWWMAYSFLSLAGLILTAVVGRLVPVAGFSAFPLLGLLGVTSFVLVFARWIRSAELWRSAVVIAGCAAFSVWASGVVWGRIYKNPLFYENFILDGKVHHDSLHLASIGNMLRTYSVATTGVDGLSYVPYHWGTQWLFAQWSRLIDAQVLDFYQLGFPVTMIPFFFGGTLALSVAMRNRRGGAEAGADLRTDLRFWGVFLAACIGIIPVSGLDAMGVWTSNILISESYTVAVPCALLMLATCIAFYDSVTERRSREARRVRRTTDALFVIVGIPIGIMLLGYLKSSLMVLAFALAIYAFVRLRLYRRPDYCASLAITALLVYVTYGKVVLPAHREGVVPFDFLWSFVRPAWWPFFIIVHLFWSWLYVLIRLRSEGIGTLGDLKEAAAERRILDVEAVTLVAVLGLAPGLVTHIDGGSAFYFSDVQRWLAVGLILSRVPTFMSAILGEPAPMRKVPRRGFLARLDAVTLRQVVIVFLLLPVVGSLISNSVVWPLRMVRANAETRHALYPPAVARSIPMGLHGLPDLLDHATLDSGLRRSPNFLVADELRRMSRLPDSVRRRTALFIPQDQAAYWHSLTRPDACTYESFVAPALASMAMIDGMPEVGCVVSRYYGMGSFKPRVRPQTPADGEPATLCRRAMTAGMTRLMVLRFDDNRRANATVVPCPARR